MRLKDFIDKIPVQKNQPRRMLLKTKVSPEIADICAVKGQSSKIEVEGPAARGRCNCVLLNETSASLRQPE